MKNQQKNTKTKTNKFKKGSIELKVFAIICIIVSMSLVMITQFMSWGELDVNAGIKSGLLGVQVNATLESEFNEYSIDYTIITNRSGEVNRTEERKIFQTGLGDFQANVGELLDSYKDKQYVIKSYQYNTMGVREYTNVSIHTHSDIIPWWPVGMAQKCSLTVTTNTFGTETQAVIVKRVWFQLWYAWDDELDDYTKSKEVWKTSPNDNLVGVGSSKKYQAEFSIDEDYGRVGLVGRVELSIINDENVENVQIEPFASTSHPSTINLFTLEQGEFYNIVLIVLAYPFTIISLVLSVIAIPLILLSNRFGTIILIISVIIGVLGIVFYIQGINMLVTVLDSSFELSGLSIDVPGAFKFNALIIPYFSLAMVLLVISFILSFINQMPKERKKKGDKRKGKEKELDEPKITFKTININGPLDNEAEGKTKKVMKSKKKKKTDAGRI